MNKTRAEFAAESPSPTIFQKQLTSDQNSKKIKIDEGLNSSFTNSDSLKSVNLEVEEIHLELQGGGSELN